MIGYLEYLNLPSKAAIIIVAGFLILQIIGEILSFKKKAVPEIMSIRKYFARKKRERETLAEMRQTLDEVKVVLADFDKHYSTDNIAKRDNWMHHVDENQAKDHAWIQRLDAKLDAIGTDTLSLLIEHKREAIINFASKVIDENFPATREQFNRIFRIHKEYDALIKENKRINGEVEIAIRIIRESYEQRTRSHNFIEDIRGYDK